MRVKTNRQFYDVLEDTYRHEGDEFEVSKERYIELNNKVSGFVSKVKEANKEVVEVEDNTEAEVEAIEEADKDEAAEVSDEAKEIDELTVAELKELLDEKGIEYDSKAKKDDLKALLNK